MHLLRCLTIHEPQCLIPTHSINTRCLVVERNTVTFISYKQHLRSESRADELSAHGARTVVRVLTALLRGYLLEHLRDGRAVLRIEICVDFVKEVERCRITLLDCEDEGECTQTWGLLENVEIKGMT